MDDRKQTGQVVGGDSNNTQGNTPGVTNPAMEPENIVTSQSQQSAQVPVAPSSAMPRKEAEPIPTKPVVEQHVTPTEHQIELSKELKEAGVEAQDHEKPELSQEAKEAGVEHAKEHTPVEAQAMPVIQLPPYTREEVLPHTKNGSVSDAARWFYTFLLRQIDKVKKQNLS